MSDHQDETCECCACVVRRSADDVGGMSDELKAVIRVDALKGHLDAIAHATTYVDKATSPQRMEVPPGSKLTTGEWHHLARAAAKVAFDRFLPEVAEETAAFENIYTTYDGDPESPSLHVLHAMEAALVKFAKGEHSP